MTAKRKAGEYDYNDSVANTRLELLDRGLVMCIERKEIPELGEFQPMREFELGRSC